MSERVTECLDGWVSETNSNDFNTWLDRWWVTLGVFNFTSFMTHVPTKFNCAGFTEWIEFWFDKFNENNTTRTKFVALMNKCYLKFADYGLFSLKTYQTKIRSTQ